LLITFFSILTSGQICRVLTQEGGASFGSYEVGALAGLISLLPAVEV